MGHFKEYEVVLQLIGRPHGEQNQVVRVQAINHDDARRAAYKRAAFEGWRVRQILTVGRAE